VIDGGDLWTLYRSEPSGSTKGEEFLDQVSHYQTYNPIIIIISVTVICGLFYNADSISDYIGSNGSVTSR
jgi:hypothetical protein